MIDRKAAQKANTAVRIARDIESESKGKVVTVPVMESPEFWAGVQLLLQGEWEMVPQRDPTVVKLRRKG
tara:strand:+ start:314 stop:520 length:207 start_codon:yes stop_codon:yes gene_type:complete